MRNELGELAALLQQRNAIDARIAAIIGRPVERGHLGEYIAAGIFDIGLATSATNKGSDGVFRSGPLAGRSVNVKFYGKREGCLDLSPELGPEYYLVLTGAKAAAASSRGDTRPLAIEAVYLFEGPALLSALRQRTPAPKIGIATSVANAFWEAAELWPRSASTLLPITDEQRTALVQFRPMGQRP